MKFLLIILGLALIGYFIHWVNTVPDCKDPSNPDFYNQ